MANESDKKEIGKAITQRLGEKNEKRTLSDLTSNDGSEDPGAALDTEFSKRIDKGTHSTTPDTTTPDKSDQNKNVDVDSSKTPRTTSTPPKGEELDAFTNNVSKKAKLEKSHPEPQADEVLNPKLSSANDI